MTLRPDVADRCTEVRLSEVVSALSCALDITEGQPQGHAVRTCLIGMRLADVVHLSPAERSSLFYTLLLKDLGCSSNSARLARLFGADDLQLKRAHKLTDWSDTRASARYAFNFSVPGRGPLARALHTLVLGVREKGSGREMTRTRCERGADIAAMLGLGPETAQAIRALDEHWNGAGMPYGLRGTDIPLLGRIAGLAQTVEVFAGAFGARAAYDMARARKGQWFDPGLVEALESFEDNHGFWAMLSATDQLAHVSALEPADRVILADEGRLDHVAEAFARVIDAKSPYTARHSAGVASIAVDIGQTMGLGADELRTLTRAGLLHDIGKLGVSNLILDKPGKLTDAEMADMRKHTGYSLEILGRVRWFRAFAGLAAAHHERLDGSGYHLGLAADQLDPLARILAVADVCEALSAERPYRKALAVDQVFEIMGQMVGTGLCQQTFDALRWGFRGLGDVTSGRGQEGETIVATGVIDEPPRVPGPRMILFPGGSVKVVGVGVRR
jgi:HD-GYP domain-containing protein (c-di-GMP phosphodiesterase class II)